MKNNALRRPAAVFLALIMTLTSFAALSASSYAKSRMKLSRPRLTLTVSNTATLKLTGTGKKASWSVSGKKLVAVATKGKKRHTAVIRAKSRAGTCYIKVKAGNKTLKCKVIVKASKTDTDPVRPVGPVGPDEPEEDDFQEKKLGSTSVDKTQNFTAGKVSDKETDAAFTKAMTETSLRMLKFINTNENDRKKNILISPDSILTAMAMVECGAENNTLAEMEKAFGGLDAGDFDAYLHTLNKRLTSSASVKYHIANSIWYKNNKEDITVKDEFIQKNVDFFGAKIYEAPFSDATVSDINSWVYNNTRGMIDGIIDRLDPETVMILLNAIAFEGKWEEEYHSSSEKPFYNEDGTEQSTASMLSGTEDTYVSIAGADGFVKPYHGGEIAFLGLQTPAGKTADQFISELTAEDFVKGYSERSYKYDVKTLMPEFKYDYDVSLVDCLKDLGIRDAFDDHAADFTGITSPEQPVVISDVLHKTHIELDKKGTKAAAVTAVVVAKASAVPAKKPVINVTLDHPFVYSIIDVKSGIPLFIGAVKTVK